MEDGLERPKPPSTLCAQEDMPAEGRAKFWRESACGRRGSRRGKPLAGRGFGRLALRLCRVGRGRPCGAGPPPCPRKRLTVDSVMGSGRGEGRSRGHRQRQAFQRSCKATLPRAHPCVRLPQSRFHQLADHWLVCGRPGASFCSARLGPGTPVLPSHFTSTEHLTLA